MSNTHFVPSETASQISDKSSSIVTSSEFSACGRNSETSINSSTHSHSDVAQANNNSVALIHALFKALIQSLHLISLLSKSKLIQVFHLLSSHHFQSFQFNHI